MGCVLKLFNHETWLFISRTSEWIRLNSFYYYGAVGGLSISDMVRILMAKGARCWTAVVIFLSVEMRRRNREEQEGLTHMRMKPKKYKESRR
jgi:hypothetical protein